MVHFSKCIHGSSDLRSTCGNQFSPSTLGPGDGTQAVRLVAGASTAQPAHRSVLSPFSNKIRGMIMPT